MAAQEVAQCEECRTRTEVRHVPHRARFGNGHRARTEDRPLCRPCARDIVELHGLTIEECDYFGRGYFVNAWHARSVLDWADGR